MPRSQKPPEQQERNSLSVELGGWFRAHATGTGVIAIPLILLLLAAVGLAERWLG